MACDNVVLQQESEGDSVDEEEQWYIGSEGNLQRGVAFVGDVKYGSLAAAVEHANSIGGTGTAEDIIITLINNEALTEQIAINKNIKIVNKEGKTVTISRYANLEKDMFVVNDGAKLTLGTDNADENGMLIVDGSSASRIAYRIVENKAGATFVLAKNASLENANSSVAGAAIDNYGMVHVYGTIQNNDTTNAGAGIHVRGNAIAYVENAVFKGNYSKGGGAAIYILANGSAECSNSLFEENSGSSTSGNGGAVHVKGNYLDTNSRYINNVGRNGGAIAVMSSSAIVTVTGTDENAIFSGNSTNAGKGGAVFANTSCSATVENYTFVNNTATNPSSDTTEKHAVDGSGTINLVNPTWGTEAVQSSLVLANSEYWLGKEDEE